jgi:hypothetical protein
MDIFRSITITLAIILLVFMSMVMYYEFKTKMTNASWPPYTRRCPDYSYEYDSLSPPPGITGTTGSLCKFSDQFDYNTFVNSKFDGYPDNTPLCINKNNEPLLWCKSNDTYSPCKNISTDNDSQSGQVDMIFTGDGLTDIQQCGLTQDGYV